MGRMRIVSMLAILGCCAFFLQNAVGQKQTREERREAAANRSVQGLVTGPDDQPVSGAIVQLKDKRTLQVRSFITQGDGMFHFSGVKNDNDYEVSVKFGEMTAPSRTLSIFDNRKEAIMNFKLDKK